MVQHDVAGIEEENDIIINPYYNINIIFKKKKEMRFKMGWKREKEGCK